MKLLMYGIPLIAALALGFALATTIDLAPKAEIKDPVYDPPTSNFTGERIYGIGIIEPKNGTISVSSPLSAIVSDVKVVAGDKVKKGDILFKLDNQEITDEVQIRQYALNTKIAELNQLKAGTHPDEIRTTEKKLTTMDVNVKSATDAFERAKELINSNAIREEEFEQRHYALEAAKAQYQQTCAELDRQKAGPRQVEIAVLECEVNLASAYLKRIQTDLQRSTIHAPYDSTVLQVNVRKGQYLSTDFASDPAVILAEQAPLQIKVQIDEEDACRLTPDHPAEAVFRGKDRVRLPLQFVRIEPYVTPKKSFSGQMSERLDTRTLTIIYELKSDKNTIYVGQQADVFINLTNREEVQVSNTFK